MENITLKEHEIKNNYFPHLVVEFEIENFGISGFDEVDHKGSHEFTTNFLTILQISNVLIIIKLQNHFSTFRRFLGKSF